VLLDTLAAREGGGILYMKELLDYVRMYGQVHHWSILTNRRAAFDSAGAFEKYVAPRPDVLIRSFWLESQIREICRRSLPDIYLTTSIAPERLSRRVALIAQCRNMLPFQAEQRRLLPIPRRYHEILNRHLLVRTFRRARKVIFVSNHALQSLGGKWPWIAQKGEVIPHGVSPVFRRIVSYPSNENGYLLYVSPLKPYKHQEEVVQALGLIRKRTGRKFKLVFVGGGTPAYIQAVKGTAQQLGLEEDVQFVGHVAHDLIPAKFTDAFAFLFASTCENCPNTLLEAMSTGIPVLCSNTEPMPEFGGNDVIYFEATNPDSIADAVSRLVNNPELRLRLAQSAQCRVAGKTWKNSFDRLLEVMEQARVETAAEFGLSA